jgi:hypothetical protein
VDSVPLLKKKKKKEREREREREVHSNDITPATVTSYWVLKYGFCEESIFVEWKGIATIK